MDRPHPGAIAWLFTREGWTQIESPLVLDEDGKVDLWSSGYADSPQSIGSATKAPLDLSVQVYTPLAGPGKPRAPYLYLVQVQIHPSEPIFVPDFPSLVELIGKLTPFVLSNMFTQTIVR